jgi:hypothetical protein
MMTGEDTAAKLTAGDKTGRHDERLAGGGCRPTEPDDREAVATL